MVYSPVFNFPVFLSQVDTMSAKVGRALRGLHMGVRKFTGTLEALPTGGSAAHKFWRNIFWGSWAARIGAFGA